MRTIGLTIVPASLSHACYQSRSVVIGGGLQLFSEAARCECVELHWCQAGCSPKKKRNMQPQQIFPGDSEVKKITLYLPVTFYSRLVCLTV